MTTTIALPFFSPHTIIKGSLHTSMARRNIPASTRTSLRGALLLHADEIATPRKRVQNIDAFAFFSLRTTMKAILHKSGSTSMKCSKHWNWRTSVFRKTTDRRKRDNHERFTRESCRPLNAESVASATLPCDQTWQYILFNCWWKVSFLAWQASSARVRVETIKSRRIGRSRQLKRALSRSRFACS